MARLEQDDRETAYRYYIANSLQLAPQNKYMTVSLDDIYNRKIDRRTAEEITEDVIKNAGIIMGDIQ